MSRSGARRIGPLGALRFAAGLIGAALWAPPATGVIVVSGTAKPPGQAEPGAQKPSGGTTAQKPSPGATPQPPEATTPRPPGATTPKPPAATAQKPPPATAQKPRPGGSIPAPAAAATARTSPSVAGAAASAGSGIARAGTDGTAPSPARAPSFSVGDRWEFVRTKDPDAARVGSPSTFTIAAVSTGAITHANGFRQTAALASLNEVVDGKVRRVFRPFGLSLRFPLTVGKTWTEAFESVDAAPNPSATPPKSVKVRASGRVVGTERVTVPAGTFDAYRVEHTWRAEWGDGGVEDGRRIIWYVPELKYWVRLERETSRGAGRPVQRHVLELRSHSVASS